MFQLASSLSGNTKADPLINGLCDSLFNEKELNSDELRDKIASIKKGSRMPRVITPNLEKASFIKEMQEPVSMTGRYALFKTKMVEQEDGSLNPLKNLNLDL